MLFSRRTNEKKILRIWKVNEEREREIKRCPYETKPVYIKTLFFKLLLRRFLCVTHFTIITMPKQMNCDFPNEKQNTLQNAKLFVGLKQFETI